MTERLNRALDSMLHASTTGEISTAMDGILDGFMELEQKNWSTALTQVIDAVSAYTDNYLHGIEGFFVCPPPVATLRYLLDEIRTGIYEPSWTIAKLHYDRELIARCDPALVQQSYDTARAVLSFLEEQYHVFSSAQRIHVLSIPACDINCFAECAVGENILEMFLNAADEESIITMSFELAAQAIANGELPEEGIQLLKNTNVPHVRLLTQEDQETCYLDAITSGMAYGTPYEAMIIYNSSWTADWNAYVKDVIKTRSIH